jgi:nucleoside-diphosphate-sugar epimerase
MTKSIMIIGGTGFFGKSILDSFQRGLLKRYSIESIIIGARNIDSFRNSFSELLNENVELLQIDISNAVELPHADIVIHAAASTAARDYQTNPHGEKINIETATTNYCDLAKMYHKDSHIVYCSSGAVYGQQPEDIELMDEELPFQDVSKLVEYKRDYAMGKRNAEKEVIKLGEHGLNVAIARCFAFYGKYLPRDQHFAYGNFLGAAERGETIEVKANHKVIRSYMHADDLVHSLVQIALASNPQCPIYNVGSDEPIEIRDLAKKIGSEYGAPVKIADITEPKIDRYVPSVKRLSKLTALHHSS